jgi:hypothetical protein
MQVVCEGIETMAMARFLRDLGAWAGQGFALYGAVSSSELLDVLERPPLRLIDPPRRTGPQGRTDPLGRTDPPHRDQVADQPVVVSHHETRSSRD